MGADAHFQVSPEIFDWVQDQAVAHSRTFTKLCISHSCCVLRVTVLLEGKLARLRFWMLWTGFSLRLSQYFGVLSFSSILMSPSVPSSEKQPHSMRLLPAHFTFGMVLRMWWAVPAAFKQDAWNWGSSDQIILFLTVWGSFRCIFVNFKRVFMCLHWGEDWVWPHCLKAQIGGVLQWCLSLCRFLLSPHMIMELNYSDHQILRHHSNQRPSASIAQFVQEASSKKNPGCFKLLPLRVTETTFFCDPWMKQNFFLNSSPDSLTQTCFLALQTVLWTPRAWFLLWYALYLYIVQKRPFIKTFVPFQPIPLEFATGYLLFLQFQFLHLRDLSETVEDVMHCRWWDLQSLCNSMLRNVVFKVLHNRFTQRLESLCPSLLLRASACLRHPFYVTDLDPYSQNILSYH